MAENVTIALAGNPNSGKTTMFNALTGSRQRVGNYPGVTVERKEGTVILNGLHADVVDLPGCYSLTAYSMEELVARQVLVEERPDVVVHVMDATVLERSLYLGVQLLEMGVPVVLALNMMDETKKRGLRINAGKLSKLLGVPVVETVGRTGQGKKELLQAAIDHANQRKRQWLPLELSYGPDVDHALLDMTTRINAAGLFTDRQPARWTAIKYIEGDEQVVAEGRKAAPEVSKELEAMVAKLSDHCQKTLNAYPDAIIADYRYGFISALLKQGVLERDSLRERIDITDKVDRVLTHRVFGPLIMLAVLYGMFKITFTLGEYPMGWLEIAFGWLSDTVGNALAEGPLRSMLVSGVIDGVGGVMGFVPLILIMFLMVSALEDLGYMARMAYMLDRVFRIFGLHGCSVMPFVISGGIAGGCAVPGIMATRTLKSPKEKLATLLTAPFMTCGAKIPVFVLLVAAFFPENAAITMFAITMFAWVMALLVSWALRSTLLRGESTPFVMELPPYRLPTLRGVLTHSFERTWAYIRKAGTVILAISILLWAAMTYPELPAERTAGFETMREQAVAETQTMADAEAALEERLAEIDNREAQAALRHSLAGRVGGALEPVSKLAGFDWRTNIALVGGVAAKEVIVSTLGTAYSLGEVEAEEAEPLSERLATDPQWSAITAISLIVFVLLYAPCFVTVVAMAKESSWRWATFSTIFNTALAFAMATAIYQFGRLLS
ncbi:ferrous iron transporter FeoB [Desulfocurvibacter africanus PCS]|uniref:Ferrous iron transport protein B n=1 Tax=Desulfocurvibacter africanus PCS TaxID=1262666 RepID=M5PTH7_DESAF|nr:ferrous iron transport protein B [Desulfocurvibacter africanus]EMG37394.1 ferrous iron transporter FeoB [Desulfocurvibacter africanus PCS]